MAGSTLFDFNSFISNGFVRAHIIFLGDLLGWPLLHINLGAKDLTPVGYTAGRKTRLFRYWHPRKVRVLGRSWSGRFRLNTRMGRWFFEESLSGTGTMG
jgi:hypothetical protein